MEVEEEEVISVEAIEEVEVTIMEVVVTMVVTMVAIMVATMVETEAVMEEMMVALIIIEDKSTFFLVYSVFLFV